MTDEIKRALFFPRSVCKKYLSKLEEFKFLEINIRNPYLVQNLRLRTILLHRRKCHKLFEQIKCSNYLEILDVIKD